MVRPYSNSNVIVRAIHKWGVKDIELHYDLDKKGYEFKGGHCWLPHQASKLIKNKGRMLVRKSGTEPKIRIMGESENNKLLVKCINIVKKSIK